MATKKKAVKKSVKKTSTSKKKPVAKKQAKSIILSDDNIDIEEFDKKFNAHIPEEKIKMSAALLKTVAAVCPQGKQPKVIRDNPQFSPPLDISNYITELFVTLSTQNLKVTWLNGRVENWLCSPNPSKTPKGNDLVGKKCGPKHTNHKRDGMAWFTALKRYNMVFGFHNSQRVAIGVVSHGCIRVSCEHARTISQNSWSGKTKIRIVR